MTRSHFIEILMILTKYVFDLGVRLTEFSVTVESVTLRFYCTSYACSANLEDSCAARHRDIDIRDLAKEGWTTPLSIVFDVV